VKFAKPESHLVEITKSIFKGHLLNQRVGLFIVRLAERVLITVGLVEELCLVVRLVERLSTVTKPVEEVWY